MRCIVVSGGKFYAPIIRRPWAFSSTMGPLIGGTSLIFTIRNSILQRQRYPATKVFPLDVIRRIYQRQRILRQSLHFRFKMVKRILSYPHDKHLLTLCQFCCGDTGSGQIEGNAWLCIVVDLRFKSNQVSLRGMKFDLHVFLRLKLKCS